MVWEFTALECFSIKDGESVMAHSCYRKEAAELCVLLVVFICAAMIRPTQGIGKLTSYNYAVILQQ